MATSNWAAHLGLLPLLPLLSDWASVWTKRQQNRGQEAGGKGEGPGVSNTAQTLYNNKWKGEKKQGDGQWYPAGKLKEKEEI